jgi:hypothetical protein
MFISLLRILLLRFLWWGTAHCIIQSSVTSYHRQAVADIIIAIIVIGREIPSRCKSAPPQLDFCSQSPHQDDIGVLLVRQHGALCWTSAGYWCKV